MKACKTVITVFFVLSCAVSRMEQKATASGNRMDWITGKTMCSWDEALYDSLTANLRFGQTTSFPPPFNNKTTSVAGRHDPSGKTSLPYSLEPGIRR
ncbi:MAG: hypothetical protein LBJ01_05990 [Tannerella sp.]|jgi:hypothetical protein|nr:hypothetical protein [Tannerella sp.]